MMLWLRLKNYMIVLISTSCKRLNYSNIYTEFDGGKYCRRLIDLKFNETKHLKVRTHWAQSSKRGVCVHSGAIWNWSQQQRPPSCAWGGPPWLSGCQSGTATHNCSMQTLQKCAHSYYFQRSSCWHADRGRLLQAWNVVSCLFEPAPQNVPSEKKSWINGINTKWCVQMDKL